MREEKVAAARAAVVRAPRTPKIVVDPGVIVDKRWQNKLVHPQFVVARCPNCQYPESEGGFCPECKWSMPITVGRVS